MTKVRLVATATGFYKGSRIRAGQEFDYQPVEGVKGPTWAVPVGGKVPALKPLKGDTKPADARAAAAAKEAASKAKAGAADTKPADAQKAVESKANAAAGLA